MTARGSHDAELVIAGGGLAAQRCVEHLRRRGFDGRIAMICEESALPYDRPPLSKAVLTEGRDIDSLRFRDEGWYSARGVELLLGVRAAGLDHDERVVELQSAAGGARADRPAGRLRYEHLLVATGGRPRRLAGLEPGGPVVELRTGADALALRTALLRGGRLLVIGAGLIGLEVASAARVLGLDVTVVEAEATPLARVLPPALGSWLAGLHVAAGIEVRLGTTVASLERGTDGAIAMLSDGTSLEASTVLAATGTAPATAWLGGAAGTGSPLRTDAGGRTALPGVYAAGDAASFPDPFGPGHAVTPHWEAAVRQGVAVARSVLGEAPAQATPAMFWSDQHGRRIQMVGHTSSPAETELDGEPREDAPFTVRITRGGRPAAALLVDMPEQLVRAREEIAAVAPLAAAGLVHEIETTDRHPQTTGAPR